MTSTELPWRPFGGRRLRPFAFALMLSTGVITYATFRGITVGRLLNDVGQAVGVAGVISVLFLLVGFWARRDHWMRAGLLISTGVWASASTVLFLDVANQTAVSAMSAACWAVAAGGAWLLEVTDPAPSRSGDPGERE